MGSIEFDMGVLLGKHLYDKYRTELTGHDGDSVCVVCESENADGLASGVIDVLSGKMGTTECISGVYGLFQPITGLIVSGLS